MSLLLDALSKKTGAGTNKPAGQDNLSELTLEELPERHAPNPASGNPQHTAAAPSPRSAGENLFAAKKAPVKPKFSYNLGIVPTTIIIGVILGTAGSIYVWYEIQPPKQAQYRPAPTNYTPPPPVAATPPAQPLLTLNNQTAPITESRATSKHAPAAERAEPVRINRQTRPAPRRDDAVLIQQKSGTDDIYTTTMAAYQAYENGDLETARRKYQEVLGRDARNRDALLGLAAIAQQQKQDERARQLYNRVLVLDPKDPVALAGLTAFSSGDDASKESKLKYSLAQTPDSTALFYALGNLYVSQSRWSEAQEAYFNALRLDPANARFAFSLATSLDHLGQARVAAQYYRQALQFDTNGNSGFDRAQTQKRLDQLAVH